MNTDSFAITLDVDWAPDPVIEFCYSILLEANLKSTWFVTHQSKALEQLFTKPELFEIGIHPNFMPGSSHGESPEEVIEYCMQLCPHATSVRTHGHVQSWNLLALLAKKTNIYIDVSSYLPRLTASFQTIYYFDNERFLIRAPTIWEDHLEIHRPDTIWDMRKVEKQTKGLKVINFHPIHLYLNSVDLRPYEDFKRNPMLLPAPASIEKVTEGPLAAMKSLQKLKKEQCVMLSEVIQR